MYSTWAEIDLGAIKNNIRELIKMTETPVMAVVKANAYGHGAVPVAKAALEAGSSWCAVARVEEAQELRKAGIDAPILLLGHTPAEKYAEMIAQNISLTVWDITQVQQIAKIAEKLGKKAKVHLKVDTGMSRLGAQVDEAGQLAREIASASLFIQFEGIFTHFARADERNPQSADQQEMLFTELLANLEKAGIRPPLIHASNSAASLTRPNARFTLLRFGIAMYGLAPSAEECPVPPNFLPALTWKSLLSQVKTLPAGRGVSYGHLYTTQRDERIGTVPVGYADGFRRLMGLSVLVGGKRVPVVGRVCMDQIMVQLDSVPEARIGDEVVIIGSQGDLSLSAEEVASTWGTINYEVTCAISVRVPRIYTGEEPHKLLK